MFTCPNCGKPGIPVLRRFFMPPGSIAHCAVCGGEATLQHQRLLSFISAFPLLLFIGIAPLLPTLLLKVFAWVVGAVCMFALHAYLIPLVKVNKSAAGA